MTGTFPSSSGCSGPARRSYLAGNREDIRLANLVSFVGLTVKYARNVEHSLMALATGQTNVITAELRSARATRSWDSAGKSLPVHRVSPPLALAVNHGLLSNTRSELLRHPGAGATGRLSRGVGLRGESPTGRHAARAPSQ